MDRKPCPVGVVSSMALFVIMLDTSEGGAVMSRCGFRSVRYLEVKIRCKNALGLRMVSAVRSLEVVASRRLPICITSMGFSIRG